jgi:2-polyprenyl-3-methyl-5-hydroxy-6-metoxy-1,4-benzoquinol methylase
MSATNDYFDAKARTWDEDPAKRERARRVAEAIAAKVPGLERMSVLEYGAGTGLLGFALQPHVGRITLADSSREMLAVAEEKIAATGVRNVTAAFLDLTAGPPPSVRYDLVCTLLTLHHVPDTDAILRAFHDLVAPGGVLCVSDLDAEDGSFHGHGFTGHHGFDRAELAARIERAGFRDVRLSTPAEIEKETAAGRRKFPLFLAIASRA